MGTSFSTALSGLNANSTALSVVGNNLANLNTTGFKTDSLTFQDLVSQSLGGDGKTQVGFGVATPITLGQFSQGAIQATGGPLDAAIQGAGFFIVTGGSGNTEYTRGGNFTVSPSGQLTTASGELLQGWSLTNGVLNTNAPIGNITVPTGTLAPPIATTAASISLNLDSDATAGPPPTTFSTSVQTYDSLGTAHTLTFTFTATGTPGQWNYSASIPDADVATPPATPTTGTLTFDSNGNLVTPAATDPSPVIPLTGLADGASDMSVTWNLYTGTTPTITQFNQPSATSAVSQNGSAAANLVSVGLSDGGNVLAQYSNGQQLVVGQLALAEIRNPDSLVSAGDSNLQTTALTALPAVGVPGTGGRGIVLGGSIEASNVNIATEFTNLIIYQQGYEANAHMVTTENQISQDTINLKQ